jgi:uncharacterized membrane protein
MSFFTLRNIFDTFSLFDVNGYPFLMMVWNMLLAMVPFMFFLLLTRYWKKTKFKKVGQRIGAGVLFFFWLIFLPNAAYIIADIRHLIDFCPVNSYVNVCVAGAWQVMFFFVYSVWGWVFFTIYLGQMRQLLTEVFNKRIAKLIILAIIPVMSLGVLFGLTERFNSWDLFIYPLAISQYLLRYMTSWGYSRNWLSFTAGYYILYFFGNYLFIKKIK